MKNVYKILMLLIVTLTLSGCTSNREVVLASKEELLERNFKEFNYDEKEAYISPDSSYVTIIKDNKIVEAFLTETNATLYNDDTGIYISNGANSKVYNDKCFISEKEFAIESKECKDSSFGNNVNKYLKDNMPEIIK